MSYLPINEQNQQAPTGQTTPAPQGTGTPPPQQSGGSVGGGTTGGAKGTPNTGALSQFGSSASKLGDYLSANAPQITQQAQNVTSGLNNQYDALNQGITNAANQFGQQVSQGYAAPNQDVVNQAMQNPTQFAQDPNNVSAFQAQYNNQYTGPQSFESTTPYSQIQGQVQNAVQQGGLLQTQAGLQSYLGGQQQNPTAASSTLDALLLRGNPQAQQQIQQAAGQFNNLTGQLQNATQTQDQGVTAAQQAAQNAQQYAQNTFNPYVQQFQTGLNTQLADVNKNRDVYNQGVTAYQTAAQQQNANLQNAIAAENYQGNVNNLVGNPSGGAAMNARIAQLLDPTATLNSLQPYLSGQPITQPGTLANTANAGQYGEDAALAQLLGQNYNPLLNQTDISQAGTYNIPTLPTTGPNSAPEIQYINDINSLYGNAGLSNVNVPQYGGWQNATPQQLAQAGLNVGPGQGFNLNPDQLAALQRLSSGEQGFKG